MAHFFHVKENYSLIEHTADIGIRVKAKDLAGLFRNAARAMFDIASHQVTKSPSHQSKKIKIKLKAENLEDLFVAWLNELLSLSATKEIIFSHFDIKIVNNKDLEAEAQGYGYLNYRMNTEIKAATYHQLKINKTIRGWLAEVIFDV